MTCLIFESHLIGVGFYQFAGLAQKTVVRGGHTLIQERHIHSFGIGYRSWPNWWRHGDASTGTNFLWGPGVGLGNAACLGMRQKYMVQTCKAVNNDYDTKYQASYHNNTLGYLWQGTQYSILASVNHPLMTALSTAHKTDTQACKRLNAPDLQVKDPRIYPYKRQH